MIFTIRPICPVGGGAWPTMTGNLEQRAGVLPFGAAVQVVKVSGEPPDLDCAKQFDTISKNVQSTDFHGLGCTRFKILENSRARGHLFSKLRTLSGCRWRAAPRLPPRLNQSREEKPRTGPTAPWASLRINQITGVEHNLSLNATAPRTQMPNLPIHDC